MHKHLLSILFLVAAAAIWWASISSTLRNPLTDNDNPVIVVSGYVPYTLTKQLAGDTVNVIMLLPPGAEPHAFEPTPGNLVSMKYADAFIYLSDELEPWARDLAKSAGEKTRLLQLAEHSAPTGDPHVWMNPQRSRLMAYQIGALLAEIAPQNRAITDANYLKLADELDQLDQDFKTALANCKFREVVHIGHLAFKNLTDTYGLTLTALAGTSHDGEHSAKKLAALITEIQAHHIPAIFTEDTLSPRLAQTVSQETNTQILPLYSIEHISKQDFNQNVTYTNLMHRNLASLVRGLQCQA